MAKYDSRLESLEKKIKDNLTRTGLLVNVNINYGEISNPENPTYIEYKLNSKRTDKEIRKGFDIINHSIRNIIHRNYPEISIESNRNENNFNIETIFRLVIRKIDEGILPTEEQEYKYQLFSSMNKLLENYLRRTK